MVYYNLCDFGMEMAVHSMDFITCLLRTVKQHDSIIIEVDRLSKVAHFIPVKTTYSASEVAQVFSKEIV